MNGSILIIDDEEQLRKLLKRIISLEGFGVDEAPTIAAADAFLRLRAVDVILCDVKLPDGNGVDYVKDLRKRFPQTEVILLTAYGNIPDGVAAIRNGAFDYVTKGDDNDRIIPLLYQALDKVVSVRKQAVKVRDHSIYRFKDIIGEGTGINEAVELARRIAPTEANVLLLGETGTGKEVFANAIHGASPRSGGPFVAINCSAFSRELLEGELFGHKAGAYTGALKDKQGLVELAGKGTLFLDEVGEMNMELQAKILRLIENREFIKLGDVKTSQVDIRIIAATNRDLQKAIAAGLFREDLYYRLNVFSIQLPPLRERIYDLEWLALGMLNRDPNSAGHEWTISEDAMRLLTLHPWKGNIRELKNVMARAVILADGYELLPAHLPFEIQQAGRHAIEDTEPLSLAGVEQAHIRKVLEVTKGNKTRAADVLGIGLTTLYRKMQEYGISK